MNRSEYKAMVDKFNGLTTALEAETNHKFVCLEDPFPSKIKLEDINKEYLFKLSHLLLQKKHFNPADKFGRKVRKVSENWMGGGTGCGNVIWSTYMFPKMSDIANHIDGQKWSQAFGSMLGLFLYLNCNTQFISDTEVDLSCISGWFSQFTEYWLEILEQSDKVLGLDCAGGLPGGYRAPFLVMLKKQQTDLNSELSNYEDMIEEYSDCDEAPIVEIFDKAGKLIGEAENKENSSPVAKKKGKEPATGSKKSSLPAATLKVVQNNTESANLDKVKKDDLVQKRPADQPIASPIIKVKKTSAKKTKVAVVKPTLVQTEQVTRSGRKSKTVDRF